MRIHLSLPDEIVAMLDAAAAADAPPGFPPDRSRCAAVAIAAHFGPRAATPAHAPAPVSPVATPAQVRPQPRAVPTRAAKAKPLAAPVTVAPVAVVAAPPAVALPVPIRGPIPLPTRTYGEWAKLKDRGYLASANV